MSEPNLPLANYDELPLATLGHRIRSLTEEEIQQLLDHEREHANRVHVIEVLTSRMDELRRGASPTPGSESEPSDVPGHKRSGSVVDPAGPREPGRPTEHGTRTNTGKGKEHH
ncbi:hypothetical protein FHX42_002139 [Saccharopolyspora lacisalsi]|uniref:DUF8129 domain-containing protein n=1 Tax=Halosaccharopolyspora lacisalsi TaxID=1000566 RepID=A0A839DS17_9PSEU|nr:hypothetical protein [Halosaccharopolyspora lacisalsi]MBA8824792.1 hypothetical protein [Halosaccharopolyspora lacisalsi]